MAKMKPIDTSKWGRNDILKEARMQSAALARLGVWKRIAYSLVAIGVIVGLWGNSTGAAPAFVAAVICVVIGLPCSIVLTVGIRNGKANVKRMLTAAGVDVDELLKPRSKRDVQEK